MDDDLYLEITKFDPEKEPFRPRLQCWDFPGQGDYLQCNLLYFDGRGIYLVFVDVDQKLDDAWCELRLHLWSVVHYARDEGAAIDSAPPVLLIATKWARKRLDEQALDSRVEEFTEYLPRLKRQLQRGPWGFRVMPLQVGLPYRELCGGCRELHQTTPREAERAGCRASSACKARCTE